MDLENLLELGSMLEGWRNLQITKEKQQASDHKNQQTATRKDFCCQLEDEFYRHPNDGHYNNRNDDRG